MRLRRRFGGRIRCRGASAGLCARCSDGPLRRGPIDLGVEFSVADLGIDLSLEASLRMTTQTHPDWDPGWMPLRRVQGTTDSKGVSKLSLKSLEIPHKSINCPIRKDWYIHKIFRNRYSASVKNSHHIKNRKRAPISHSIPFSTGSS